MKYASKKKKWTSIICKRNQRMDIQKENASCVKVTIGCDVTVEHFDVTVENLTKSVCFVSSSSYSIGKAKCQALINLKFMFWGFEIRSALAILSSSIQQTLIWHQLDFDFELSSEISILAVPAWLAPEISLGPR